jgi:hypothetical protein
VSTYLGVFDQRDVIQLRTYDPDDATSGITNEDGDLTDPTALELRLKAPGGTVTTYTYAAAQVVKDGTGRFRYALGPGMAPGLWEGEWVGTGAATFAERLRFVVRDGLS